jgi:TonB family protein
MVGSAFFSALIPLIQTEWVKSFFITEKVQDGWQNVNFVMMQGFVSPIQEESTWALGDFFTLIYIITVIALIIRLSIKLYGVKLMFKSESHPEAFSFFRKIKVNENLPQKEQIEKHELTHAQQLHSADVLFFEILSIINWFNPVVYLYKKSIRQIHEFIADEEALQAAEDKQAYALLLFSKSFGINPHQLTNNFFNQSLLKRRIQMIQKPKSRKAAILKYGLSAPLFLLAMILSSATISENKTIDKIAENIAPTDAINIPIEKAAAAISDIRETINLKIGVDTPKVEQPSFPGGMPALGKFLGMNLRYPKAAKDAGIQGKVVLSFIVDQEGSISDIKVLRGIGAGCDEEAIRVLKLSPKWEPATQNGKKVRVLQTLPINFRLDDGKSASNNSDVKEVVVTGYATPQNYALNEVVINGDKQVEQENPVFTNVEVLPTFPGGLEAFGKFLAENLKYPAKAKENNIQGRVFLNFVVEKDGSLSDIKVVRGIGYGCDEEAVRVLAISPKWIPGKQNGKLVRVSYTIPIFFQMTGSLITAQPRSLTPEQKAELDEMAKIVVGRKALYVIDGKIIESGGKSISEFVTASDMKSVNVLKGEEAIKAYGDKGKNGVIIITTKTDGDGPIIYQDGKTISNIEMKQIDPKDIEALNVLKGDAAIKKYGDKGKNGVIEIATKKKN